MNPREAALQSYHQSLARGTDLLIGRMLVACWALAIALAIGLDGHVGLAVIAGGLLTGAGVGLASWRTGSQASRHVLAIVLGGWSVTLTAIVDGRVDGLLAAIASLAVIALYRDWRVLVTATAAIVLGQLALALAFPIEPWPLLEHLAWLAVIDTFLIVASVRGARDQEVAARRVAQLTRAEAIIERKVSERTLELVEENEQYRTLVESTEAVAFEYDTIKARMMYIAPQAARLLECELDQLADHDFLAARLHRDDRAHAAAVFAAVASGRAQSQPLDCRVLTTRDRVVHTRTFLSGRANSRRIRGFTIDITRQKQLEHELQQAQKLESVGRLAAGVAHEINTPIQFVGDSVEFVREAVADVLEVVAKQRETVRSVLAGAPSQELAREAEAALEQVDLPYLVEHLPQALARAADGVERVGRIVRSMKVFAHPDRPEMLGVDLNQSIASTLTLAHNEYRYVAELETDFGELPLVWCHAGDLNQIVLNVIINAAQAIAERPAGGERGRITVTTRCTGELVTISVADNGCGIPANIRPHILEPFFTTKDVGQGTGQGLAIARALLVERYRGTLTFETEVGEGTTFHVTIPANNQQLEAAA